METTVILPTYNEAENLPKIVSAILAQPLPNLGVLVVDDNSPDGTGQIADRLAKEYPGRVQVVHRPGKQGLGPAYIQGFQTALQAGAEYLVQMDSDFSHPPEKLLELRAVMDHCDIAIGSRYTRGGSVDVKWPLWRKWLSAFGNFYARTILNLPIRDVTGGFRMWKKDALLKMPMARVRSSGYGYQVETAYLAHLLGLRFSEIPIYFADRTWGTSKMSLKIQVEAAVQVWKMIPRYRDLQVKK